MRSRLLAACLALSAPAFAADPPKPDPESDTTIVYEMRVVTVPAETVENCGVRCPAKEGEVALLSAAQVRGLFDVLQTDRRAGVLQAPKVVAADGEEVTVRIVDRQDFVTGLEATRVKDQVVIVPQNKLVEVGETLTVGGTASADGKTVAVRARYTSTQVVGNVELHPVVVQITPVFEGGSRGAPVPVTQYLQAPKIETVTIDPKELTVPSGGHAVVAGPTILREERQEFGPPVLSKIPYLNRLYKNVGVGKVPVRTFLVVSPKVVAAELPVAPMPRAVVRDTVPVSAAVEPATVLVRMTVVTVPAGLTAEAGLGGGKGVLTARESQMLAGLIRREPGRKVLAEPALVTVDRQPAHVQVNGNAVALDARLTPVVQPGGKSALLRVATEVGGFGAAGVQKVQTTEDVPFGGTLVLRGAKTGAGDQTSDVLFIMTVDKAGANPAGN